jgi:hypothetical protein
MPRYFAEFLMVNQCPGVLLVSKKLEISVVIDELILIWTASEADEFVNSIKFLPI